jgi:hypothetical protein
MTPYDSQMPMGQAAIPPLDLQDIIGAEPAPAGDVMAAPSAPPAAQGMMDMGQPPAMGGGGPMLPEPEAGADLPFSVEMQPDGSSIDYSKTEPRVVIAVNKAPKLPTWMEPQE